MKPKFDIELWRNETKRILSSNRTLLGACSVTVRGTVKEAVIVEQRGTKVKLSFDGGSTALPADWFENSEIKRHW